MQPNLPKYCIKERITSYTEISLSGTALASYRNKRPGYVCCAFMGNKTTDSGTMGEIYFVSVFYSLKKTGLWKNGRVM